MGPSLSPVHLSLQVLLLSLLSPPTALGAGPLELPRGPLTVANQAGDCACLFLSSLTLMALPGFWPQPPTTVTVKLCG